MDEKDLSKMSGYGDNDDDFFFEEIFEIVPNLTESEDGDDDKGDDKENRNRSTKAKKIQFKKIADFMKAHKKSSTDKKQFNKLWSKLTGELNLLGPPTFTETQWRFKWSQHKYNKKRKRVTEASEIGGPSCQEKQSHKILPTDTARSESTTNGAGNLHPEILDKLNAIIQKEDHILMALERGNNLLQEISHSLNKQNC